MAIRSRLETGVILGPLLLIATTVGADEGQPPRRDFAFPIEVDFDRGAANGNATIMRLMPLASFPMGERWSIVNLALAIVADAPGGVPGRPGNPEPGEGGRVFGLGDLTDAVFFTPPSRSTKFVWGFGPAVGIPIATDARLGSGKWSLGPAIRMVYRPGQWNIGVAALNLVSVAGDDDRADVDQLLIRTPIRRRFKKRWYFVTNPIITANWNASADQRWLVPLGGGVGRSFTAGGQPMAVSIQAYANVIKPDGAPDGLARIQVVLPIPKRLRRR
jgi:hypothetical protein